MNAYEILNNIAPGPNLTQEQFNQLVADFQKSYLNDIDFENRLEIHRFPDQFKGDVVRNIYDVLQRMHNRDELRDNYGNFGSYVISTLKAIWESDKRINTTYQCLVRFCELRARDFNTVAVHVAEYTAMDDLADQIRAMANSASSNNYNTQHMPKNFDLEIRESPREPYLKVFLKPGEDYKSISKMLTTLHSVRRANVTQQLSGKTDLTIYPQKAYDIKEVEQEVALTLENYFKGSPIDPAFVNETLSGISEKAYYQILDYILLLGKNLESFKELNARFDEERYRDYFIPFLNAISKDHAAKGEVFNRKGKTDIIVFDKDGNNVFIAECKLWKGEAYLVQAIDQLLNNYVNWRDEKVALIIFNRDVKNFSEVISNAQRALSAHPFHFQSLDVRRDTSFSFIFRHPDDDKKKIQLELLLLNFA